MRSRTLQSKLVKAFQVASRKGGVVRVLRFIEWCLTANRAAKRSAEHASARVAILYPTQYRAPVEWQRQLRTFTNADIFVCVDNDDIAKVEQFEIDTSCNLFVYALEHYREIENTPGRYIQFLRLEVLLDAISDRVNQGERYGAVLKMRPDYKLYSPVCITPPKPERAIYCRSDLVFIASQETALGLRGLFTFARLMEPRIDSVFPIFKHQIDRSDNVIKFNWFALHSDTELTNYQTNQTLGSDTSAGFEARIAGRRGGHPNHPAELIFAYYLNMTNVATLSHPSLEGTLV